MTLTTCLQNNDPALIILYFSYVILHIKTVRVFKIDLAYITPGTCEHEREAWTLRQFTQRNICMIPPWLQATLPSLKSFFFQLIHND